MSAPADLVTLTLPLGPQADPLADAIRMAGDARLRLQRGAVVARAARPALMAMQSPGRATCLFHGLSPADLPDLLATVSAYLAASNGWIIDARACGRLRFCLLLRVPFPG